MTVHYDIDNIHIIWKDIDSYVIETPLGNFDDINEAVKLFPNLTEDKHIVKCNWCGGYFVRFGNKYNKKKTCSKECARQSNIFKTTKYNYDNYKTKKRISKSNIHDFIQQHGSLPEGFNQDDNLYGLGESNLTENVAKNKKTGEYDWDKELKAVQKEKRRLMNR